MVDISELIGRGRLTIDQRAALSFISQAAGGEARESYIKTMAGVSRLTILSLWRRDLLSRRDLADSVMWGVTDAGRALLHALDNQNEAGRSTGDANG